VDQRIKDLEKKRGGDGDSSSDTDSSFDLESIQKLLADYAKKSDLKDYCLRSESEDLSRRLGQLEARVDRWEPDWSQMKEDIRYLMDSLYSKVERNEFDISIDRLKQIIQSMSPGNANVTAAFDSTDLKEAVLKLQTDYTALNKDFKSTQTLALSL
jgi:flagellar motility protein MotE (MotC chaperone)